MTDILSGLFSGAGGTLTIVLNTLLIIMGALVVFGMIRFLSYLRKFNIKVEITDETGSKSIISGDKARELTTLEGRQRLQLFKNKINSKRVSIGIPNPKFIDITTTGKKYLRLKKIGSDQYIPWHPNIEEEDSEAVKQKIMTSDERTAFIGEYEQSEKLYPKKGLMALLEKFMPAITVVICVIAVIMVISTISDTQKEIGDQLSEIRKESITFAEDNIKLHNRMLDFLEGKQIIGSEEPEVKPE